MVPANSGRFDRRNAAVPPVGVGIHLGLLRLANENASLARILPISNRAGLQVAGPGGATMPDDDGGKSNHDDAELERSVRSGRKFTLAESIGRLAGPGLLKGASPATKKRQVDSTIKQYLAGHLEDGHGALRQVLRRRVTESRVLLDLGYEQPLVALEELVDRLIRSEGAFHDFVRAVDAQWARSVLERPRFQRPGQPPCPDDPYTFTSVVAALQGLLADLRRDG